MIRGILASLCFSIFLAIAFTGITPLQADAASTQGYNYSCGVDQPSSTQCSRNLYREMRSCQQKVNLQTGAIEYACLPTKKAQTAPGEAEKVIDLIEESSVSQQVTLYN